MSQDEKNKGLYQKYLVSRADGTQRDDAKYFVLRYDECPKARMALRLYATLQEKDYPQLAVDVKAELDRFEKGAP
jgi:Ni,Fe-hydrogenase III component G